MPTDVEALAGLLSGRRSVLIVTGAGISTSSGIPDFRGPNGVWKTQTPVMFQDFVRSEEHRIRYWRQKADAASVFDAALPGVVHDACVRLEQAGVLGAIVTQNVDGLHQDAGSSEAVVIEVHGTGRQAKCLGCGRLTPIGPHLEAFTASGAPPRCVECGDVLKPATISFGQQLDPVTVDRAVRAAESADLAIALGSTLSVYPAADLPLRAASLGAKYAIVNRGETNHDGHPLVTLRVDGNVDEVFPAAVDAALGGAAG